ncbi:hypothetical protein AO067_20880 [Pseudomonas viridiflava ICMP 13104]|uniref:RNA helicase n=1 Tax=Pseudomonas viridiflava ICMP 13104 TaxID=1198305 RepID=A0A0W0H2N8_PSEVI|nr:hypothetical protein AO067_20880 [Pseudomonas viridiflava ICMP 13104]
MAKNNGAAAETVALTCGLVMPISAMDGCSTEHWVEVKNIICDAVQGIEGLVFIPKLVSEQDDVGVIQKRIVQNIYTSDMVICDVSCKNANVMFELGMRLAFDKPTILIKDDKTDFSFDTGVIEHLLYPRDLRFSRIVTFKQALAEKVEATYQASIADPNHSTFLKNFGSFKVASVEQTVGTPDQVMLDMMQDLTREVARISRRVNRDLSPPGFRAGESYTGEWIDEVMHAVMKYKKSNPSATWISCRGHNEFYQYLVDNCPTITSNFKTYEKFISAVESFLDVNHQLFA